MKTELAKALITSSLGLAAVSCGSKGGNGAQGAPGTIPLATLNVDITVACRTTCTVTNNESNPIFCFVSLYDTSNDTPGYNSGLVNPGATLTTSANLLTSTVLCDTLCWNDTGMIQKVASNRC